MAQTDGKVALVSTGHLSLRSTGRELAHRKSGPSRGRDTSTMQNFH